MSVRRLSANAFASAASTVVSALLLFVLYRFLIQQLGVEQIGVWSLVLVSCSIIRLAEFGMAGGVAKFVAHDVGAGEPDRANTTLFMAVVFLMVSLGVMALLCLPLVRWIVTQGIDDPGYSTVARTLVPWCLLSVWLSSLVGTVAGALDGKQRTDLRAYAMVIGGLVQVGLAYLWVPDQGLRALGFIQVAFVACQLLCLLTAKVWLGRSNRDLRIRWSGARFKEMLRYGMGIQIASIGQLMFEPVVRWLLSVFSGLTIIGYYDLANRAVSQFRQVMVAGYQMLVPYYATQIGRVGKSTELIPQAFRRTSRLMLLTSVPYFALIGAALPFLLTWWLGEFNRTFVWVGLLCLSGWFINSLAVPAFMLYIAVGRFKWVATTQFVIGILNVVLGCIGGWLLGGVGVVAGAMLALSIGSTIVSVKFHQEYQVAWNDILPVSMFKMGLCSVLALAGFIGIAVFGASAAGLSFWVLALFGMTAAVLAYIVWHDPLRSEITKSLLGKR